MNFKKIGKFLLYLLPWFLSALLFRSDSSYFNSLNRPFFAPAPWLFGIVWPILYIFIMCYIILMMMLVVIIRRFYLLIILVINYLVFSFLQLRVTY